MISTVLAIIIALVAALAAAAVALLFSSKSRKASAALKDAEMNAAIAAKDAEINAAIAAKDAALSVKEADMNAALAAKNAELASKDAEIAVLKSKSEAEAENLKILKEAHAADLNAIRTQMTSETEKILKQREEELSKKAEETFRVISGDIGKDLNQMKEAFEANKKTQSESHTDMKATLENAVKNLRDQAGAIGNKADHLADALRGRNKMQGCWGETILANIFSREGLVEGRDYDKEFTLRDEMGLVLTNEDSGKRMRPDFILHFPDNTDIVVDSKVSLTAYADWTEAETDEEREDAANRNLQAIREQVRSLAGKRYWDNLPVGKKGLDYVVMFIPNYGSLQLARQSDPDIIDEAFRSNVLITTEETIMPFLRMIRTAWVSVEQVRNQEKIVKAAQMMVERVADFCDANAAVGKKLQEAMEAHERGSKKLQEGGQSIVRAANEVVKLGVAISPTKHLPESE